MWFQKILIFNFYIEEIKEAFRHIISGQANQDRYIEEEERTQNEERFNNEIRIE